MLKIKDNVDLKELEKYDFKLDTTDYYYDFIPYKEYEYSYVCVHSRTKEILLNFELEHCEKAIGLLYDLIQAGLVEKVDGE